MNIEQLRDYCTSKTGCTEDFPFDNDTLVFRVFNKIFALTSLNNTEKPTVNLKGDPEKNEELREIYEGIKPGYHMNKKHWNTIYLNSDVENPLIFKLIDESYNLIINSLPKSKKTELGIA
ncbi:MAG: MmcQ/YjbR family DNA-binding protein [Saprospiraceae bacterium]